MCFSEMIGVIFYGLWEVWANVVNYGKQRDMSRSIFYKNFEDTLCERLDDPIEVQDECFEVVYNCSLYFEIREQSLFIKICPTKIFRMDIIVYSSWKTFYNV